MCWKWERWVILDGNRYGLCRLMGCKVQGSMGRCVPLCMGVPYIVVPLATSCQVPHRQPYNIKPKIWFLQLSYRSYINSSAVLHHVPCAATQQVPRIKIIRLGWALAMSPLINTTIKQENGHKPRCNFRYSRNMSCILDPSGERNYWDPESVEGAGLVFLE